MSSRQEQIELLRTFDGFRESSAFLRTVNKEQDLTEAYSVSSDIHGDIQLQRDGEMTIVMPSDIFDDVREIVADFRSTTDVIPEDYLLELFSLDPFRPDFAVAAIDAYMTEGLMIATFEDVSSYDVSLVQQGEQL